MIGLSESKRTLRSVIHFVFWPVAGTWWVQQRDDPRGLCVCFELQLCVHELPVIRPFPIYQNSFRLTWLVNLCLYCFENEQKTD
jgi:hypothetical protein